MSTNCAGSSGVNHHSLSLSIPSTCTLPPPITPVREDSRLNAPSRLLPAHWPAFSRSHVGFAVTLESCSQRSDLMFCDRHPQANIYAASKREIRAVRRGESAIISSFAACAPSSSSPSASSLSTVSQGASTAVSLSLQAAHSLYDLNPSSPSSITSLLSPSPLSSPSSSSYLPVHLALDYHHQQHTNAAQAALTLKHHNEVWFLQNGAVKSTDSGSISPEPPSASTSPSPNSGSFVAPIERSYSAPVPDFRQALAEITPTTRFIKKRRARHGATAYSSSSSASSSASADNAGEPSKVFSYSMLPPTPSSSCAPASCSSWSSSSSASLTSSISNASSFSSLESSSAFSIPMLTPKTSGSIRTPSSASTSSSSCSSSSTPVIQDALVSSFGLSTSASNASFSTSALNPSAVLVAPPFFSKRIPLPLPPAPFSSASVQNFYLSDSHAAEGDVDGEDLPLTQPPPAVFSPGAAFALNSSSSSSSSSSCFSPFSPSKLASSSPFSPSSATIPLIPPESSSFSFSSSVSSYRSSSARLSRTEPHDLTFLTQGDESSGETKDVVAPLARQPQSNKPSPSASSSASACQKSMMFPRLRSSVSSSSTSSVGRAAISEAYPLYSTFSSAARLIMGEGSSSFSSSFQHNNKRKLDSDAENDHNNFARRQMQPNDRREADRGEDRRDETGEDREGPERDCHKYMRGDSDSAATTRNTLRNRSRVGPQHRHDLESMQDHDELHASYEAGEAFDKWARDLQVRHASEEGEFHEAEDGQADDDNSFVEYAHEEGQENQDQDVDVGEQCRRGR